MLIASIRNANPACVYLMLTKINLTNISCYVRKFTDFTLHHTFCSRNQYFAKGTVEITSYNLRKRKKKTFD